MDVAPDMAIDPAVPAPARCPVPHVAAPAPPATESKCPVHSNGSAPTRTRADAIARTVLRLPPGPTGMTEQSAHTAFQRSMAISALRCTLTYVVFPILIPLIGFTAGVGPALGILIGVTAIGCDAFTIRRFFAVDHRWRWQASALVAAVAMFLTVLLVEDIARLTG